MIRFSLRLPDDVHRRVKLLAERERRSINDQIVRMLETHPEMEGMAVTGTTERYDGWTIRTGFLGGNLFGDTSGEERPIDYEESVRRYGEMLQEALEREFPGARIIVRWETHASGAIPHDLQTRAFDPEGIPYEPGDAPYDAEGVRIASRVDEIAGEIWESWEWVVYEA